MVLNKGISLKQIPEKSFEITVEEIDHICDQCVSPLFWKVCGWLG
jgi:hypothetical protein